nr:DNA polymerase III subunit gamma/tau [Nocardioidaceae bacterium]
TLFKVIDKVVDTGQDPRRFAEDLLHRLRDLVVVSAVPQAASRGLLEISDDQADRLSGQSSRFGRAELTRAADIVSQGLTDMRGATAPRLLLEMMCARILLPGADQSAEGLGARVDRLERRLSMPPSPAPEAESVPVTQVDLDTAKPKAVSIAAPDLPASQGAAQADELTPVDEGNRIDVAGGAGGTAGAKLGLVDVRQLWPGVLDRVMFLRRYAWVLLSQNAHVKAVEDRLLTIGFVNAGARDAFMRSGADEILRQALIDELGVDWRVEAIIDVGGDPGASRPPRVVPPPAASPTSAGPTVAAAAGRTLETSDRAGAVPQRRADSTAAVDSETARRHSAVDDDIAADDEVSADSTLTSHELLVRELGAKVIDDIRHDAP